MWKCLSLILAIACAAGCRLCFAVNPLNSEIKQDQAHLRPVTLPEIKPVKFDGAGLLVKLPCPFSHVVMGGGARFLIFHLEEQERLAIFDLCEAKIVNYLPLEFNNVSFAAGADKLVVVERDKKRIHRFDLFTIEKELTRPLAIKLLEKPLDPKEKPSDGRKVRVNPTGIAHITMGSASNGPMLLGIGEFYKNDQQLLDLDTLGRSAVKWPASAHWGNSAANDCVVRASANGRVFASTPLAVLPSGLQVLVINDNDAELLYEHGAIGPARPSPDGKWLYSGERILTNRLKPVSQDYIRRAVPSTDGAFHLQLGEPSGSWNTTNYVGESGKPATGSVNVHAAGELKHLFTIPYLFSMTAGRDRDFFSGMGIEFQRVYFIPDAQAVVYLPPSNDRVIYRRVNLEKELEKK